MNANYYNPHNAYYQNPYYNHPYYQQISPQERLAYLEGRPYPPQQQQPQNQQVQPPPTQQQNAIMVVKNEQQAKDFPVDLNGSIQIFVLEDESKLYFKRLNMGNALAEFAVYEKVVDENAVPKTPDNPLVMTIVNGFNEKLDTLHDEIKNLMEALSYGNKPSSNSKFVGKSKPDGATNIATSDADGAIG